ncbi:MAG: hypothetical protein EOO68_10410 [Moraxellaceae bacterium]|nr:MAG: hypothetical protein EOO68_10410 [Moraxellaceae bacterium]
MQIKAMFKLISATAISLALIGCGGGKGSALDNKLKSSSSSAFAGNSSSQLNSNSSATSSVDTTSLSNIGYGSGSTFQPGKIGVGIGTNALSAGGKTKLIVNMVSVTGNLFTKNVTVNFNSRCLASEEATLSETSVSTSTGEASTEYTAAGCIGDDQVTATLSYDGEDKTAQTTLTIAADTVGSINFTDATPTIISLKGTGGNETAAVRFQVKGVSGAPVKGVIVNFTLSTKVGGLDLTSAQATTDSQGYASTTVQAGTIATPVTVTAVDSGTLLASQSSELRVSTGIPDQKSMSLAATLFTPTGWGYQGAETTLSIYLADAFNNFAPDGTTVSFTTDGGAIEPGCNTEDGKCSVVWRSQNPRPVRAEADESSDRKLCDILLTGETQAQCEAKRAGRITVLATAIGNESFLDVDGDGYFTPTLDTFNSDQNGGDCTANEPVSTANVSPGSPVKPCDDLSEAYLDKDESKTRESNEPFIDFNVDTNHTPFDGEYNGALCKTPGNGCSQDKVTIRREKIIIMACDQALTADATDLLPGQPISVALLAGESITSPIVLADCNGNGLPAGSTVKIDVSTASDITGTSALVGGLADSVNPSQTSFTLKASDSKVPKGTVYVQITVPITTGGTKTIGYPTVINPAP